MLNIKRLYRYISIVLLIAFISYFGFLYLDAVYFNKQFTASLGYRMSEMIEGKGEAARRLDLAKSAYMMGRDNLLFGVGRGNYPLNSEQYHRKLGIDTTTEAYRNRFSILIPHNTYMGFFAELGILGLALFLSIFYRVFKVSLKKSNFGIITICLFTLYLVQAIAVNLENFRGIWFILGLVFIYDNKTEFIIINREKEPHRVYIKRLYLWNAVFLCLSILVYLNAVPYYTNPIMFDKVLQSQDITNLKPNEQYVFRYNIKTKTEDISKPSSQISVYGVGKGKNEVLLNQITHYAPNGYGNLLFVPDENIKSVRIKTKLLDSKGVTVSIEDASVVNVNTGEGYRVFTDYKYVPNSIESFAINLGLIRSAIKIDTASIKLFANKIVDGEASGSYSGKEDRVYFDGSKPINLSNKILFLGATIDQVSESKAKISLVFKSIGKMDIDYRVWMHGITIDKGILPEDRQKYGFENFGSREFNIRTSDWNVGQFYENSYIIDLVPGLYDINFGLWNPRWKDGKEYRLYPVVDLGNIQIKLNSNEY